MDEINQWIWWLKRCPGMQWSIALNETGPSMDNCGIFPLGTQVLHRQTDVVGNQYSRVRSSCRLRVVTTLADGALWMAQFARWVEQQNACGSVPGLGDIPQTETVTAEKGRLEKQDAGGTATYGIDLVCEYTRVYKAEG